MTLHYTYLLTQHQKLERTGSIEQAREILKETHSARWRKKIEARLFERVEEFNKTYRLLGLPSSRKEVDEIALNTALRGHINNTQLDGRLFQRIKQQPRVRMSQVLDIFIESNWTHPVKGHNELFDNQHLLRFVQ
ncbi:MAG: hypothetical protein EOP45_16560 [Sphingobacteriaceae bacterium]|nr:MAG: hypothetical protein EOP45_16560 [Sphingobacteriaceae bacterium]